MATTSTGAPMDLTKAAEIADRVARNADLMPREVQALRLLARHATDTVADALQVADPATTRALADAAGDGKTSRHAAA